jgi:uncharacterized protein with GYD domain
MNRYLVKSRYATQGVKSVIAGGGTARRIAVEKTITDLGGRLDSFHFAFGEDDVYAIVELPDHITAAAVALAINASGFARVNTTVLLTPEEVDTAAKRQVSYTPPG